MDFFKDKGLLVAIAIIAALLITVVIPKITSVLGFESATLFTVLTVIAALLSIFSWWKRKRGNKDQN